MKERKITPDSTIEDIVTRYPDSVDVFFKHGIPAIACGAPIWGTVKENAERYGVKDLDALLDELNAVAEKSGGMFILKIDTNEKEEQDGTEKERP